MISGSGMDAGQTHPSILLPEPQPLFSRRARRLRVLAESHPGLAGYLTLLARLAERQAELVPTTHPLRYAEQSEAHHPPGPPLSLEDESWGHSLAPLLKKLVEDLPAESPALAGILHRLDGATPERAHRWLAALLSGDPRSDEVAVLPFAAAALQILLAHRASLLDVAALSRPAGPDRCPVCGGWPVVSSLSTFGGASGLRYLHCSFCASEWLHPRIQCVHCGSGEKIAYYGFEGAGTAVQAETCDACRTYLKRVDRVKTPDAEPCADDLATLALDLLLGEQGYQRLGNNPLLPMAADLPV